MEDVLNELTSNCEDTVEYFRAELSKMKTGRASAQLLDSVNVDYYGSQTPLNQLGLVNAPEPRLITVQVYDAGAMDSIEKAIQQADLGLNPARDGNLIRIPIPPLTEERRKELIKVLHKNAEEIRVTIRNHRRDAIENLKKMEKEKELSEDQLAKGKDEVQKIVDERIAKVDSLLEKKEQEMLEV